MTGPDPESIVAAEVPPGLGSGLLSRRTLLSFLVAFGLLALVFYRLGPARLSAVAAMVRRTELPLYALAVATYYTAFPIRAARWRLLLRNAGVGRQQLPAVGPLAGMIFLSWFANSLVPAKLGDVYRGYLVKRHAGVSWSLAMGTIVAERVLDLIVLVMLMLVTGTVTYGDRLREALSGGLGACYRPGIRPDRVSCALLELLEAGVGVVLLVLAALLIFARYRHHLVERLPERLAGIYHRFGAGLILSFGHFPALISLSVMGWLAEGAAFWLVSRALHQVLPLPVVVFFSLLQAFITVIPVTPGGLGFEVLLAAALQLRGLSEAAAWALTALYRSISYVSLVLFGALAYLALQILRRPRR